jgi:prepilin signal peptidase PulO-like enzyme (type II secretory pathway)
MNAKHDGGLIKFMHFSNRLCFYGIGLIGVLFLVAYHTSVTLFPLDSDLLPISGTLLALIAILFFSIDRTMESQAREIEIAHRFAQVFFALAAEGQALGSAEKRGQTRAAAEKIEELKENLKTKIIKAEKHLRSEWRFVVVSIVTVLLGFEAVLSSLKH